MGSNNLFNFIYVGLIAVGAVAMALSIIQNIKIKSKRQTGLELFFSLLFVYIVSDFVAYYFMYEGVSAKTQFALITVSDIFSIFMVSAWAYLILLMAEEEKADISKYIIMVTGIYIAIQESASVIYGKFSGTSIVIESPQGKYLVCACSIVYFFVFTWIGIVALRKILKQPQGLRKKVNTIFAVTYILYSVWLLFWDFNVWFVMSDKLKIFYALDPIFVIYIVLTVAFVYYFMKQDPLKLTSEDIAPEGSLELFVERYNLSAREKDVLECINDGKSNHEIAEALFISENTVKRHVNNIFKKTESKSRHELIYKLKITTEE